MRANTTSRRNWWQTLPGIVTAVAGLISACAGLLIALYQIGWFNPQDSAKVPPQNPPQTTPSGPVELSTYIYEFMLPDGIPEPDWYVGTHETSLPITWLTLDQVKEVWERQGIARIKVGGAPLKTVFGEVKWQIRIIGSKFGPESVTFEPTGSECFGVPGTTGCEFDILSVLLKSGIDAKVLCNGGLPGMRSTLYFVTSKGRRDAYLIYEYTEGSGGASSWVTLYWKNPFGLPSTSTEVCKQFYEKAGSPNFPLKPVQ